MGNSCACTQMFVGAVWALPWVFWEVLPWKSRAAEVLEELCGSVDVVQLCWPTVSPFPEPAPPAVCPQDTLPWDLQSPKCSGICVCPAEGHCIPSVLLPYPVNHFASQKFERKT